MPELGPALAARDRRRARRPRRGAAAGWALACATLLAAGARPGLAGRNDNGPGAAQFAPAVRAWQSKSAKAVAALVPGDGRLSISLEGTGSGRVTGRPTREQAEAVLKGYFDRVEGAALKDVTPEDARAFTRTYDYTYRPRGAAERTTRLSLTLQTAADGAGYVLVAVEERVRR